MPRLNSPAALLALRDRIKAPLAPSGKVWDSRIAQAGTAEALLYILEGWEICSADAMPSKDYDAEGKPIPGTEQLDQLLHFRKLVPFEVIQARALRLIERVDPTEVPGGQAP